jgi:hypothetical protein
LGCDHALMAVPEEETIRVSDRFAFVCADKHLIVIAQTDTVYHEINRATLMAFSRMSNGERDLLAHEPANAREGYARLYQPTFTSKKARVCLWSY